MFTFDKGTPENLEGRVIAYATIANASAQQEVIALYGVADKQTLTAEVGNEGIHEILDAQKKITDTLLLAMERIQTNPELRERLGLPPEAFTAIKRFIKRETHYSIPVHYEPNITPTEKKDVINLGTWTEKENAGLAIHSALNIYFQHHKEQQTHKKQQEPSIQPPKQKVVTYKNFIGQPLKSYLVKEIVSPLIYAVQTTSIPTTQAIKTKAEIFGKGSAYEQDLIALITEIEHHKHQQRVPIIQAWLDKIEGVNTEDYEAAHTAAQIINANRQ
ncbi:MAG: hypothetical protein Q7R96_05030 [Nanoarchaeota archaeon]|nr:hypothetical protein [Nanoarchaeota archaeon]